MKLKNLALIILGVGLLFLTSQISIPIGLIPITMQTVGVMLIALAFRPAIAITTVLIYLTLGVLGLPVFANFRSGLQVLFGPSGGFLWGFLAAVMVMNMLKQHLSNRNLYHICLNCCCGTLIILIVGVIWLAFYIGLAAALKSGFYPFIIPGLIKIFFTSLIFYAWTYACDRFNALQD